VTTAARSLEGKVAIVTGAGSGIGRAIAGEMALAGARLMLAGRRLERLSQARDELAGSGSDVTVHAADVSDASACEGLVAAALEAHGRIDILVNNAGVSAATDLDNPASIDEWESIIATNLTAVFTLSRLALKHMQRSGRIINIASVLGERGAPGAAAYCASKHGVIGLTRALALDVAGRGITVNAVCPGWVDTEMAQMIVDDVAAKGGITRDAARAQIINSIPMKRMVEAREVAQLVVYLASAACDAVTGQAIKICAGSSLV
jgi:NAD(P)-dependent dehydrogenase (short-subunit alcohol dehydrogenase family)